jgi:hypothetical protein
MAGAGGTTASRGESRPRVRRAGRRLPLRFHYVLVPIAAHRHRKFGAA